jgi:hypothetical protein
MFRKTPKKTWIQVNAMVKSSWAGIQKARRLRSDGRTLIKWMPWSKKKKRPRGKRDELLEKGVVLSWARFWTKLMLREHRRKRRFK